MRNVEKKSDNLGPKSDGQRKSVKQQDAENQTEVVSSLKACISTVYRVLPALGLCGYALVLKEAGTGKTPSE